VNGEPLDAIVRTLLYEGYVLYPYRPSAVKNRQRFNFGVLYPQSYCQDGDAWQLRVECPVRGDAQTHLQVTLRFLQLVERSTAHLPHEIWHEAFEREVPVWNGSLAPLLDQTARAAFGFASQEASPHEAAVHSASNEPTNAGEACLAVDGIRDGVYRLTVRMSNLAFCPAGTGRDTALLHSFVSTHVVIRCTNGALISLLDPPGDLQDVAATCTNVGVWPVLVGRPGTSDCMLASPNVLYDYPDVAPESAGDLFDGTEIDEILALRILTMTEDEKREARASDDRVRAILDRTELLGPDHWAKLHGALRGLRPASRNGS
jgi:hypothetical protein